MKFLLSLTLLLGLASSVCYADWMICGGHIRNRVCHTPCPVAPSCPIVWIEPEFIEPKEESMHSSTVDAGTGPTGFMPYFSDNSLPIQNIGNFTIDTGRGSFGGGGGSGGSGNNFGNNKGFGGMNGVIGNNGFGGNNGMNGNNGFGGNNGFNGNNGMGGFNGNNGNHGNHGFNGNHGFGGNYGFCGHDYCNPKPPVCHYPPCDDHPVNPTPAPPALILAGIGIGCIGLSKLKKKLFKKN